MKWTVIDIIGHLACAGKNDQVDYFKDIGLTYVIIPIVTLGAGKLCTKRAQK